METHGAWFPWTFVGLELIVQGQLSYMADVHTFGRRSWWKLADAIGAIVMTTVAVCAPLFQFVGWMDFPTSFGCAYIASVAIGLFCKHRGTTALRMGRCEPSSTELRERYLFWHCKWHLLLPIGCSLSVAWLSRLHEVENQVAEAAGDVR